MAKKVHYITEMVAKNKAIKPDGFVYIKFENLGDIDAAINGDLPLSAEDMDRSFGSEQNELPIVQDLSVQFVFPDPMPLTTNPKVLVTKKYIIP